MRCPLTLSFRIMEFSGSVMATGWLRGRDNARAIGTSYPIALRGGLCCSFYAKPPSFSCASARLINQYAFIRPRRALLVCAQQPGVRIVADDPAYHGESRSGATLRSAAADNRTLVVAGMAGATLAAGDYIEVNRDFHAVTAGGSIAGNGDMTVDVAPHARPSIPISDAVQLIEPVFMAVVDQIRPALFETAITGETTFTQRRSKHENDSPCPDRASQRAGHYPCRMADQDQSAQDRHPDDRGGRSVDRSRGAAVQYQWSAADVPRHQRLEDAAPIG